MPDVSDKDLVEMLIYVLHRGSIDCIANHMFRFSRFSLNANSPWVARITLRGWMLQDLEADGMRAEDTGGLRLVEKPKAPDGGPRPLKEGLRGSEDDPIYIPIGSKRERALNQLKGQHKAERKQVVLTVSSVVMTTTAFGDFSKITIISKIIPGSKLRRASEEAQKLWRVFVHQPQTARCLVFLLLLGLLCQEIAQQYNKAGDYFADILSLDVSLLTMVSACLQELMVNDRATGMLRIMSCTVIPSRR